MLRSDKRPEWGEKNVPVHGKRVIHYWDEKREIGKQYGKHSEKSDAVAWDVYYLYEKGAEVDSLLQPWISFGGVIIGVKDRMKNDLNALIKAQ